MSKKLLKKIEVTGIITLKTGLHIGGSNSAMNIGGIDKSVIRNPFTNQPFIPGSSLKGKMRSLFEVAKGCNLESQGGQIEFGPSKQGIAANLFGNAAGEKQIPSRLIVRDSNLVNHEELLKKTEIPYTEGKTEVVIDRITSAAMQRQIERVPAGAQFGLNMVLNIWESENENELLNHFFEALWLLKDDYLGGGGSRGNGQLDFKIEDIKEKTVSDYYDKSEGLAISIKQKFITQLNKLHSLC